MVLFFSFKGNCYEFIQKLKQFRRSRLDARFEQAHQASLADLRNNDLTGWMYEHGYYVEQSYEKAVEWYEKAAEQNRIPLRQSPFINVLPARDTNVHKKDWMG